MALTRTQKRQKETKERIFHVAMNLFITNGFENTTVSEITEAADIGKGTFFTYFPTKEAIFRQLGEMMTEKMANIAEVELKTHASISAILKKILMSSVDWHEAHKPLTRQMITSHFSIDDKTSSKGKLLTLLMTLIHKGQKKGELNSRIPLQDAAIVLIGSYFAAIAFWAISENTSLQERLSSAIDIVLKGLQSVS